MGRKPNSHQALRIDQDGLASIFEHVCDSKERRKERIMLQDIILNAFIHYPDRKFRPYVDGSLTRNTSHRHSSINIGIEHEKESFPLGIKQKEEECALSSDIKSVNKELGVIRKNSSKIPLSELARRTSKWVEAQNCSGNRPSVNEIADQYEKFRVEYRDAVRKREILQNKLGCYDQHSSIDGFSRQLFIESFEKQINSQFFRVLNIELFKEAHEKPALIQMLVVGSNRDMPFNVNVSFKPKICSNFRLTEFATNKEFVFLSTFIKFALYTRGLYGTANGFVDGTTIELIVLSYMGVKDASIREKCQTVAEVPLVSIRLPDFSLFNIRDQGRYDFTDLRGALYGFLNWVISDNVVYKFQRCVIDPTKPFNNITERQDQNEPNHPSILARSSLVHSGDSTENCVYWDTIIEYFKKLSAAIYQGSTEGYAFEAIMDEYYEPDH